MSGSAGIVSADMPTFTDEQQVYARLGKAFQDLVADPDQAGRLTRANLIVQYQFRKPESTITVKLLRDEAPEVQFGPTTWRTEVVYAMDADTAHAFFSGEVNVSVALSRGDIRASGPVKKILEVVPLLAPVIPVYREVVDAPPAEPVEDSGEPVALDADGPEHEETPAGEEPETAPSEDAPAAEDTVPVEEAAPAAGDDAPAEGQAEPAGEEPPAAS